MRGWQRTVVAVTAVVAALSLGPASMAAPAPQGPTAAPRAASVWTPAPGTTWQWQISGKVDTSYAVDMYDVDLFEAAPGQVNHGIIDRLHSRGIVVVCYVDTGAWESYRPDAKKFPRSVIGNRTYASTGAPWVGERWLDIRKQSWPKFAPIMWHRLDLAKRLGCDGVEPDENNPWGNKPGFPITLADQKRWYLKVAAEAHRRGLSVGMKNGVETIDSDTVAAFDWALNEECFQYHECGVYQPFADAGKAVFQVEYRGDPSVFCPKASSHGFSSLKKHLGLGSWVVQCWNR